ncbi:MAG: hypothetical protein PHT94_02335 [Candidatus Nanoarchaeia archaeon]|nr:hypothetical protein [Candidatus Nanoarchaeia archaeon]
MNENKKKIVVFSFFTFIFLVLVLNSQLILSQSDVNDLLIFETNNVTYGFNTSHIMFSDGLNYESLGNMGNTSWVFDKIESNQILNAELFFNEYGIYLNNSHMIVYRNTSNNNYYNATLFNMNNYVIDTGYIGENVSIYIKDLANNVIQKNNQTIKTLNGLNYLIVDLSSLYDGIIEIEVFNTSFYWVVDTIVKSSFYNTSFKPNFFYINLSKGNFYHEINLKNNSGKNQEFIMFYNQGKKYYELVENKSLSFYNIFSINNDNSVVLMTNEVGFNNFYMYKYIDLTELISDRIFNGAINQNIVLDNNQPFIYYLPDGNHKVFLCREPNPYGLKNCTINDFSNTFLYNHNSEYPYLFVGLNITNKLNHTYFNFTLDNSSLYNIRNVSDEDGVYNGSIYHLRFSIELEPGNYTLFINDTLINLLSEYRKFNTSLFINNKLNRTINDDMNLSNPEYHHYDFELLVKSNVSLLDSRIDANLSHDIILSRYYKMDDFSRNIPIDLEIRGTNFYYSVCNYSQRNDSNTKCDYYLSDTKEDEKMFSFDDPYIFIDYDITNLRTYKIFNFSNSNEFNFTFVLTGNDLKGSSHFIEYDVSNTFYHVKTAPSAFYDMTMDWSSFKTNRPDKNCNIGYNIDPYTGIYLTSLGTKVFTNQKDNITISGLSFYNNYLLFRKCYDGEWIPLYPKFNFLNEKEYDEIRVVNEENQCGILQDDKDYYLDENDFKEYFTLMDQNGIISNNKIIKNSSFVNYHQCYNGEWISSTYQNFNSLLKIADVSNWNNFSIYCDWTSNLDLIGDFLDYSKYPQGCVLKNLKNNEIVLSLLSNEKDNNGFEINNLNDIISQNNLDFSIGITDQIANNFNLVLSDSKDFLLIYNKSNDNFNNIKDEFGTIQTSNLFTKIIVFFKEIFNKILGIKKPEGFDLQPRDYHAIFYVVNGEKEIYSYAYVNKKPFNTTSNNIYSKHINYTIALGFKGFSESDIIYYNRSLKEYTRMILYPEIDKLIYNVSLGGYNSNMTFINEGFNLNEYLRFYNDYIPSLRIE